MNKQERKFAEIYNDLYPLVFTTLYSKTGNRDDAIDITQEIFMSCYKHLDTIENHRKWLNGAIRYNLSDYYKKKKENVDIDDILHDASITFVNGFRDTRIIMQEAFDADENFETETDRILFDLIAIKRFTYEEAGEQLGMTKRQVRYYYGKIVDRMLDYLAKKGIKNVEELL